LIPKTSGFVAVVYAMSSAAHRVSALQETPDNQFLDSVVIDLPSLCCSALSSHYLCLVQFLWLQFVVWIVSCYCCLCVP